ncbi:MAG TPA: hypothetical protein VND87_12760 [Stellaceae bacterium]|nr:hypothetical protein [Stellaceae bacterium]
MMSKTAISLAFAASLVTAMPLAMAAPPPVPEQLITNGPQVSGGDHSANWSARQNINESHRYDRLVETNPAFRAARMRKECGPITDPQLHASCVSTFNRGEPMAGSSMPRHPVHDSAGND